MHNKQKARAVAMHGDGVSFQLLFTRKEAIVSKRGDYTSVSMGVCGSRGKAGEPSLPWRRIYVFIPEGATFRRVTFKSGKVAVFASNALIQPIQPLMKLDASSQAPFKMAGPNPKVYGSAGAWPKTPVHFAAVRRLGGLQMALVDVCPFQYYPAARKLGMMKELSVTIEFKPAAKTAGLPPPSAAMIEYKRRMTERVGGMVINPENARMAFNGYIGI
jgi:hypothetical protein